MPSEHGVARWLPISRERLLLADGPRSVGVVSCVRRGGGVTVDACVVCDACETMVARESGGEAFVLCTGPHGEADGTGARTPLPEALHVLRTMALRLDAGEQLPSSDLGAVAGVTEVLVDRHARAVHETLKRFELAGLLVDHDSLRALRAQLRSAHDAAEALVGVAARPDAEHAPAQFVAAADELARLVTGALLSERAMLAAAVDAVAARVEAEVPAADAATRETLARLDRSYG